ncbi:Myelin-associated glycoprotein [Labeo rohita]|uniref:Myelin-associated glycoprotein n=1 Tax=Labeo rohita TaxID=84645 RepID=A0ABQ8M0N0_LABRO|nr:Myelin-associated glycoprotein [Labeo rohita]
MVFWSCLLLFIFFLWLRVSPANAENWNATVPKSVVGLSGSCVEIPCTFVYPTKDQIYTEFTGIWLKKNEESTVYNPDASKIIDSFKGRTSLIGDLRKNDCSLKISSLSSSDAGQFVFRIEIEQLDMYTYKKGNEIVSLIVQETAENPTVFVEEEATSGKPVTATCNVSHSCPSEPPRVTWSHNGTRSSPSQTQNSTSYSLTFTPSREDHNKILTCSAEFKGKTVTGYKTLKVKYPPYNVHVVTKSSVKENDSVELTCSSDSNPPANSYEWFTSNGTMLANSPTYKLEKVSRHTEAISCTAINTLGKNSSDPPYNVNVVTKSSVKENDSVELSCSSNSNPPANSYKWFSLNGTMLANSPTYKLERVSRHTEAISCTAINTEGQTSSNPPEIKSESSCQSTILTVCVCIVDSNPLSEVKWFGPDSSKTFSSTSIKQNESLTIFTLQGWLGFPETVQCFANNSLGSSSITLEAPQKGIMTYIAVASAVVVVLVAILVYVVGRRCRKRATQRLHHISQYIMGNGTSRPLMTQDSRKNIRRNKKLSKDDPEDEVHFTDALRKDKHSKVLSRKDYSVAKLNLARGNRIRYCHLSSGLESKQEPFSVQNWEIAVNDDIYSQGSNFDAEMFFWSYLLSLFLWLRVSPGSADDWRANVPESVVGLSGSCVEIPCKFSYPAKKTYTEFTGIWYKGNGESTVYHTDTSKITDTFKGRTSLIETPENPSISVEEEVTSVKPVTATCIVSHSCPSDPPRVTWNHDGTRSNLPQPQNHGQWKQTSYTLIFTPSREDHNKILSCSALFKGKTVTGSKTLKNGSAELICSSDSNPPANIYEWFRSNGIKLGQTATYKLEKVSRYTEAISCTAINTVGQNSSDPPYNVNVVSKLPVKENDSVQLNCSSDSNPPANSYEWFSLNGTMLANSPFYKLEKVSRHTEVISCTAINTLGKNSSNPPEIKSKSSCQSTILTVCVCIVDSNPASEVKWFGPDSSKTFSSTSIKQNESLTIFTLQGWLGFPETVQCFANNSLGSSSITLKAPQNGIIYIMVTSAVVVVLVAILVSKEDKGSDGDIYTNCQEGHVYDNWGVSTTLHQWENFLHFHSY